MKTYDHICGSRIDEACAELVALAKRFGESVEMIFNDIRVVADPNDDPANLVSRWGTERDLRFQNWKHSPEGIAEAQRRRDEIARKQAAVDALIARWDKLADLGWDVVLRWAEALTENADDVAVKFDRRALAATLRTAGYAPDFGIGHKPSWFNTPDRLGGYIMGQIVNCLESRMPPHPVTLSFIEKFRSKFQTAA